MGLFESIETADTVELMGYLTGTTAFAKRGDERAARFLAEGCAIESEHRANGVGLVNAGRKPV